MGKGEATVTQLIEDRHLQRVAVDSDTPLHFSLPRNVTSAAPGSQWKPTQKPPTAWPTMPPRKSATALLAHQGLRPTTGGGHLAVVEAMRAQFPGVPGLTSLDRLRRRRNQAEYPNPAGYDPITADEANEAIQVAVACVTSAERLLELEQLGVF
jgi:hypothetical protein